MMWHPNEAAVRHAARSGKPLLVLANGEFAEDHAAEQVCQLPGGLVLRRLERADELIERLCRDPAVVLIQLDDEDFETPAPVDEEPS